MEAKILQNLEIMGNKFTLIRANSSIRFYFYWSQIWYGSDLRNYYWGGHRDPDVSDGNIVMETT